MVKTRLQKVICSLFLLAGMTNAMASGLVFSADTLSVVTVEEESKEMGLLQLLTPSSSSVAASSSVEEVVEEDVFDDSVVQELPEFDSSQLASEISDDMIISTDEVLYPDLQSSMGTEEYARLQREMEITNMGISEAAQAILLEAENAAADRFDAYNTFADCSVPGGLFMPSVFANTSVASTQSAASRVVSLDVEESNGDAYSIGEMSTSLSRDAELDAMRAGAKAKVAAESPWLVQYAQSELPEAPTQEVMHRRASSVIRTERKQPEELSTLNMGLPKVSYWKSVFTSNVLLSQLSLSDNWYQGGVGNLNLSSSQNYNISYDDQNKIKFSTNVLWKLGLNSAPDDTVRSYYLNEDLFRIESAYSVQAYERWYYNLSLLFNTQLFNNFTSNTDDKVSSFMSPSQLNIGLGMLYSYTNKSKTFTCSATMSPLALDIYFVVDSVGLDYSNLSLDEGEVYMQSLGSNLEYKMTWKIQKDLSWTTRFFVFTDYDYVQSDLENTITFAVSRYFSTNIFLHLRYDDSVDTTTISPWQVKEQIGFGFNYTL